MTRSRTRRTFKRTQCATPRGTLLAVCAASDRPIHRATASVALPSGPRRLSTGRHSSRCSLRETGWDERSLHALASRLAELQREQLPRGSYVDRFRELLKMRKRACLEWRGNGARARRRTRAFATGGSRTDHCSLTRPTAHSSSSAEKARRLRDDISD